jgi:hypothetical protein
MVAGLKAKFCIATVSVATALELLLELELELLLMSIPFMEVFELLSFLLPLSATTPMMTAATMMVPTTARTDLFFMLQAPFLLVNARAGSA